MRSAISDRDWIAETLFFQSIVHSMEIFPDH